MKKTVIKILCLGFGLAMGLLLVAKVYFEQTYDGFYPHADRIYKVNESVVINGEYSEYGNTAGAIGPGIKEYTPQVEAATRYTYLSEKITVQTDDKRRFDVKAVCLADSCLFDVLPRDIIAGDYRQVLSVTDQCMIPRSLARKMGDNVTGMRLFVPELSASASFVVGGVYDDFPLNSDIPQAIFVSLKTIGKYMYDGTQNWIGNDRYRTYVRLSEGADAESVATYLDKMVRENVDKQFNIADMYECNANFFDVLGIPVVQGAAFAERTDSTDNQIMVDEVLVQEMKKHFDWNGDVVGRNIFVTGHGNVSFFSICGVFRNIRLGNICAEDKRGAAVCYTPYVRDNLYIRLNAVSPEAIAEVQGVIDRTFPTRDIVVYNYKTEMAGMYDTQRNFRDSIMIAGIVTIVIAFIGLIGYTADEVNRRRKEIAIRKVNGSLVKDIMMLFVKDMLIISVPSLVVGSIVAAVVGHHWLLQFSEQVALAPWLSVVCVAVILAVVIAVVIFNCSKIATSNPVEYLRNE